MSLAEYKQTQDQKYHLFDLVHDEYQESVIQGYDENYQEWADFAAWLIIKVTIPCPRDRDWEDFGGQHYD